LLQKFKQRDVGGLHETETSAKKKQLKIKEMYKPLTDWWKQHLEKNVEKVAISNRLVDEPAFVFTS
jgi:HSP90 family molecular chaperone